MRLKFCDVVEGMRSSEVDLMTRRINQLPQLFEFASDAEHKADIDLTHQSSRYRNRRINQLPQLFEFASDAEHKADIDLTHPSSRYRNRTRIVREEQRSPSLLSCGFHGKQEARVQASASISSGGVRNARREFPPPLEIHTIGQIGSNGGTLPRSTVQRVCFKPIRRDGRLILIETQKPAVTAYMQTSRSDGRLRLRLYHPDETFMSETNADTQHVCDRQVLDPLSKAEGIRSCEVDLMTSRTNQLPQLFEFAYDAEHKGDIDLTHQPARYTNCRMILKEEQKSPAPLSYGLNGIKSGRFKLRQLVPMEEYAMRAENFLPR
ncbi:hypothetical protein KP509_1Z128600 [Ceratopteris richardii]|nr:hypothetical protein KP509_1Z128600 [Ceratopteris richardii]